MSPVVLRYFDCRSRGQALRFALWACGIAFEDVRLPTEELERFRRDAHRPEIGGPFRSLPVLDWDGHEVAQTLAIARYLSARLGLDEGKDPEARSFHDMIVSAAHLDMQVPYRHVLWLPAESSDEGLRARAAALLEHLEQMLRALERLHLELPAGAFFGGATAAMSDFFVYESIDRARDVFGGAFDRALAACPRMGALAAALDAHERLRAARERGAIPARVTASPSEPALRRRLPDLLG